GAILSGRPGPARPRRKIAAKSYSQHLAWSTAPARHWPPPAFVSDRPVGKVLRPLPVIPHLWGARNVRRRTEHPFAPTLASANTQLRAANELKNSMNMLVPVPDIDPIQFLKIAGQGAGLQTHADLWRWLQGDVQKWLAHDVLLVGW